MENRINRKGDESLYQPKIHSSKIRELYRLKEVTGAPMTVLLDFALQEFFASYGQPGPLFEKEEFFQNMDEGTWEEICEMRRLLDELDYAKSLEELKQIKGNAERRKTN